MCYNNSNIIFIRLCSHLSYWLRGGHDTRRRRRRRRQGKVDDNMLADAPPPRQSFNT